MKITEKLVNLFAGLVTIIQFCISISNIKLGSSFDILDINLNTPDISKVSIAVRMIIFISMESLALYFVSSIISSFTYKARNPIVIPVMYLFLIPLAWISIFNIEWALIEYNQHSIIKIFLFWSIYAIEILGGAIFLSFHEGEAGRELHEVISKNRINKIPPGWERPPSKDNPYDYSYGFSENRLPINNLRFGNVLIFAISFGIVGLVFHLTSIK